jgi:hypothetical protein
LRQGWGVNRSRGQKSQFQHGGKRFGYKSMLQQSGNEGGQKVYGLIGQKKEEKKSKKLSNISSNLVKINKNEITNFFEN